MVSISACHADDPGSIPGRGIYAALDVYVPVHVDERRHVDADTANAWIMNVWVLA